MNAERNGSSTGQILHVVKMVSCGFLVLSFCISDKIIGFTIYILHLSTFSNKPSFFFFLIVCGFWLLFLLSTPTASSVLAGVLLKL